MPTIAIPDYATDREAAAIARKAMREQRKADREASAKLAESQQSANNNALRVFQWFHRGEKPDSFVSLLPNDKGACVTADPDSGEYTIHRAFSGSVP